MTKFRLVDLIAVKRLELSGRLVFTVQTNMLGEMKAVEKDGRWLFIGRALVRKEDREEFDQACNKILEGLYDYALILPVCETCQSKLHEGVCIDCEDV